jgi:hypothetical protein
VNAGELVRIEAALLDLADTHRKVIDAIAAAKKSSSLRSRARGSKPLEKPGGRLFEKVSVIGAPRGILAIDD